MPSWANEKVWARAKAIFKSEYGREPHRKVDWKIVMTIYENIIKNVSKKKRRGGLYGKKRKKR